MTRALSAVAVVCALALSTVAANATPRHHAHKHQQKVTADSASPNGCVLTNEGRQICGGAIQRATGRARVTAGYEFDGAVLGGRPAGCPHAFCGCGLSLKLFGRIRPELNLAWNWARYFPRARPAPRMAAVRRGHVMGLLSYVSGNDWLVYDANSGNGLIREHVRSIKGYVIVDPFANRMAMR